MTSQQLVVPRDVHGRFAAGNPGRAFGSRNRVSKRVARAILADFEAHQDEVLAKLRRWFAPQYVSLVARLLPRVNESGAGVELDALDELAGRWLTDLRTERQPGADSGRRQQPGHVGRGRQHGQTQPALSRRLLELAVFYLFICMSSRRGAEMC